GEVMRLSDMQAMLVLQGVLKGFKRLREKELKIKPQFDVLNNLKKKPRSRETQFVELDFPAKTKRKSRKKNDIAQTLAEKSAETSAGISAKEIRERFLKEKEEDDSWMDDILGD